MSIQSSRITLTLREPYCSLLLHYANINNLPVASAAASLLAKQLIAENGSSVIPSFNPPPIPGNQLIAENSVGKQLKPGRHISIEDEFNNAFNELMPEKDDRDP